MDSITANLLVGLPVNISRSDGRVHSANVKAVDQAKCTVMVEWHEKSVCRGKEIEVDELWTLNKELLEHIKGSSEPSPIPPPEKKYEGRLRSSRIPAPSNYTTPAVVPEETVPRKSVVRQTCLFRTPAPIPEPVDSKPEAESSEYSTAVLRSSGVPNKKKRKNDPRQTSTLPPVSEAFKENEELKPTTSATGRRKSVLPQDLNKGNKRLSCSVKATDNKKGKFGDTNRPNKQFFQMIEDYRETLTKAPVSPSDVPKNHRICVCVRKRPLNKQELMRKEIDVVTIPGNGCLLLHEPKTKVDLTKYLDNQVFHFDYSFEESSTNDTVYRFTAKPLVQTIFEGSMATCFAYGQTGSGKTHTMGGDFSGKSQNSSKGIYALAAQDVFTLLRQRKFSSLDLCPYVSFFEIYNGKVYDLLNKKTQLRVLEDDKQLVQVVGLQEKEVSCPEDVIRMIETGSACRTSGQTSANANSSRSHAILQVILRRRGKLHGKFSLVDLAGNERGTEVSGNDRAVMVETAEINRSLLALKECIRSLGQNSDHIPFRMSKLTQVLRDSFIGENSRTCMIAMVSPGMVSCDYTLNTLRYADRVKELNGRSKASGGDAPQSAEVSTEDSSSEEVSSEPSPTTTSLKSVIKHLQGCKVFEDSIVPMTSMFEEISQVAEMEEMVHEELKRGEGLLRCMEKTSYDVEAGLPELEEYATKLLERVRGLRAAVSEEQMSRLSPKLAYR
ncbi:kinesin-like protein KIF2C isoform X2 [Hypomesus transpacificus]|uniref:kinesin-like protein KIF2C isoform X2 n=1 Tax=Hypomesus transpacificus TaxID=137520 RepID=UPI001F07342E|nr:kinesin-like protein KIF2C isoform X2 [Hypomesus transpacificus]